MPRAPALTDPVSRWERGARALAAALAPFLTIACCRSPSPTTAEDGPTGETAPLEGRATEEIARPSCGKEVNVHRQGYDAAARDCLWEAYRAGKPAEFVITVYTVEGDPITYSLRVVSSSTIEVIRDSKDSWGPPTGVTRARCKSLERKQYDPGQMDFVLKGCSGPMAEISVP